jgi:hypothetical protein
MNRIAKLAAGTLLSVAAGAAFAAGSPGVERNTQAFLDALAAGGGKPLETLSPADARAVLVGAQAGAKVPLPPADVSEKTITADGQPIRLTIVRPAGAKGVLPAFMFFHGGGWILGDFPTHERFVRDLVADSGAVAVFFNYTPSPEARYPVAINQAYAATKWVAENGAQINVDGKNAFVYVGPPPSYTGCVMNTWVSTGNLATPAGFVDTSQLPGGAFYDTFAAADLKYGSDTVTGIQLVIDSGWFFKATQTVIVDNVMINDTTYTFESKESCKDGGWENFIASPGPFKNQGDCVSFFASGDKN